MRIVDIREKAFPLRTNMRNAAFDLSGLTTSVVAVVTDQKRDGKTVVGYAWGSLGKHACGGPMRGRFIPRVLSAAPDSLLDGSGVIDPEKVNAQMSQKEKQGGHAERSVPIGIIDTAVWDAVGKIVGKPVWRLLADRYNDGRHLAKVPCYVGGGWYLPGNRLTDLEDELKRHRDAGYRLLKIKSGGLPIADDVKRVEAGLKIVGGGDFLAVDFNCALDAARARDYAKAYAPYRLRWFEEPLDPLDLEGYAALAAIYEPPLAQGECLNAPQEVRNFLRFGGFRAGRDILQIDPPQAYGISMMPRYVKLLEEHGASRASLWPHGGNLMSFHVVAGLCAGGCEGYPQGLGEFSGFADDMKVEDGFVAAPERPGLGWEGMAQLYPLMRSLHEDIP
ncbi:MAG TPA: enolase C-terminal domain-like protein [Xanthobacteraceae bacterium]|nr:enolase C-terminal domain-like protein [Xanthobacteraceae bacterium]